MYVMLAVVLLTGCASDDGLDRAMALRQQLCACEAVSFEAEVTADYADKLYTFGLSCTADGSGDMRFEVTSPESIAGITGTVSEAGGALTFDDRVLAFELLADGQLTPVSAPWLLLRALRSGYLHGCAAAQEGLHLTVNDSYQQDALQLEIWLDDDDLPTQAEILWQGRRIVSLFVKNFTLA